MYREKIEELIKWKKEDKNSMLIIKGAPRTGKTWLLKEFGEKYYDKSIYINLKDNDNNDISSNNKAAAIRNLIMNKENETIIEEIESILGITNDSNTDYLIILDNIEYNKDVSNNLKKCLKQNRKFDIIGSISKIESNNEIVIETFKSFEDRNNGIINNRIKIPIVSGKIWTSKSIILKSDKNDFMYFMKVITMLNGFPFQQYDMEYVIQNKEIIFTDLTIPDSREYNSYKAFRIDEDR